MKNILAILFLFCFSVSAQTTRDSLVYTTVTVPITHDTTFTVTVTQSITHDSSYVRVDTIKIPVPSPQVTLKGMYVHPDQCAIGNISSEDAFLTYAKRQGTNVLNMYARAYFYTETKRTQLAAFKKKAVEQYGMIEVSVDVRLTDNRELPGIIAYMTKYKGTIHMVNLLAEFEPYVLNSTGQYDDKYLPTYASKYNHFFYMLRTVGPLSDQYGFYFDWYMGWVGKYYKTGVEIAQEPFDSLVKYIDRVALSNYVSQSNYTSTDPNLGPFDARMDKRCNPLAIGCQRMGRTSISVYEILSMEMKAWGGYADYLGVYFKSHSFYGSTYTGAVQAFDKSTAIVKQYVKLIGRTIFQSRYAIICRP